MEGWHTLERLACYVLTQYNICFIYIILWLGIYYYQLITEGAELYLMVLQLASAGQVDEVAFRVRWEIVLCSE